MNKLKHVQVLHLSPVSTRMDTMHNIVLHVVGRQSISGKKWDNDREDVRLQRKITFVKEHS